MPLTIRRRLVDRVRQYRKMAYAVCAGLVVFAGAVVFLSVSSPASSVELATGPTFFDPDRTLRVAEEMLLFPNRTIGSQDAAGAAAWLEDELSELGIPNEVDTFTTTLGDENVTLRNVTVVLKGASKETIVVTAPRDTSTIVKVDPLAYTSATAILVELVQVFAARPHQKTLVFLSTEDGNSGGLGISRFLDTYEGSQDVSVILSIQGLGKERTRSLQAGVTAPQNTTPGWYVQLTGRILEKAGGLGLQVPGMLSQAADQALALPRGDQVAGLSRGIASLMVYDETPGSPTVAGLSTQGAAVERLILSLDAATETPSDPGTALLLQSGRYLTDQAIALLAILMLLPTIAALLIWVFTSRVTGRAALRHLRNLLSFALPLGFVFLIAYVLSLLGLIPHYSLQVPTIAGPATEPRLVPTLILIVVGLAALVLSRHFLGYLRPREERAATEMARLSTGFLSLLIGLALMLSRSPFLLLTCVAAAWAWPLATCFAEPVYKSAIWRHRLTSNAPVLLLGLVAPIILYAYVATAAGVGWWGTWWFLLVQTVSGAYGVRGPVAMVFITAAFMVLLGVKRMRVVPIETLEVTDELSLLELPVPRERRSRTPSRPPLSPWS